MHVGWPGIVANPVFVVTGHDDGVSLIGRRSHVGLPRDSLFHHHQSSMVRSLPSARIYAYRSGLGSPHLPVGPRTQVQKKAINTQRTQAIQGPKAAAQSRIMQSLPGCGPAQERTVEPIAAESRKACWADGTRAGY